MSNPHAIGDFLKQLAQSENGKVDDESAPKDEDVVLDGEDEEAEKRTMEEKNPKAMANLLKMMQAEKERFYEEPSGPSNDVTIFTSHRKSLFDEDGQRIPKRPKVIESYRCELCNVNCTSQIVFDSHLSGKKHLKVVKRLQEESQPPTIQSHEKNTRVHHSTSDHDDLIRSERHSSSHHDKVQMHRQRGVPARKDVPTRRPFLQKEKPTTSTSNWEEDSSSSNSRPHRDKVRRHGKGPVRKINPPKRPLSGAESNLLSGALLQEKRLLTGRAEETMPGELDDARMLLPHQRSGPLLDSTVEAALVAAAAASVHSELGSAKMNFLNKLEQQESRIVNALKKLQESSGGKHMTREELVARDKLRKVLRNIHLERDRLINSTITSFSEDDLTWQMLNNNVYDNIQTSEKRMMQNKRPLLQGFRNSPGVHAHSSHRQKGLLGLQDDDQHLAGRSAPQNSIRGSLLSTPPGGARNHSIKGGEKRKNFIPKQNTQSTSHGAENVHRGSTSRHAAGDIERKRKLVEEKILEQLNKGSLASLAKAFKDNPELQALLKQCERSEESNKSEIANNVLPSGPSFKTDINQNRNIGPVSARMHAEGPSNPLHFSSRPTSQAFKSLADSEPTFRNSAERISQPVRDHQGRRPSLNKPKPAFGNRPGLLGPKPSGTKRPKF